MSDNNDLWVALGKVQRTQAEQERVIAGLVASVQRLEEQASKLPPLALTEDRSPEQLAADGDAPPAAAGETPPPQG